MAFNPMALMGLQKQLQAFGQRHPKFRPFLSHAFSQMQEGNVLEISLTDNDGNKIRTNIRITSEDTQFLQSVVGMVSGMNKND